MKILQSILIACALTCCACSLFVQYPQYTPKQTVNSIIKLLEVGDHEYFNEHFIAQFDDPPETVEQTDKTKFLLLLENLDDFKAFREETPEPSGNASFWYSEKGGRLALLKQQRKWKISYWDPSWFVDWENGVISREEALNRINEDKYPITHSKMREFFESENEK